MNTLKKVFAITLCLLVAATCLVGCHKKGEIALKIGEVEFTSGYYACALVFADTEARSKVEKELSKDGELPENIDYYKNKVEDTDYVKWVEENTLKTLKELAAVKTLCKEVGVELDAEAISLSESNADYLWNTYGYAQLLESNGVSEATFKQYMLDTYLASEYFEHIYGKGGEKEIAADKLTTQLNNNYALVNIIEVDYSTLKEEEKQDKLDKLATYHDQLKAGSKSFEEIYLEYNQISADTHTHEQAAEGEKQPLDPHAAVLGAADTDYASDYYDAAKAMANGEIKVVTLEGVKKIALIVKKDILADPYYIEEFDLMLRNDIAGEENQKQIEKHTEKLECNINNSAIKQFKVKKIKYPEAAY